MIELISVCAQEEEKYLKKKNESANMVYQPHPKGSNYKKKENDSKRNGQTHNPKSRSQNLGGPQAVVKRVFKCFFCKKKGHKKFEYFRYKNWLEKKNMQGGNSLNFVCFESILIDVPLHSWWLDSGASICISNSLQAFINKWKATENELNLYVENGL